MNFAGLANRLRSRVDQLVVFEGSPCAPLENLEQAVNTSSVEPKPQS